MLDELRITHGRLDEPVPVGDEGGTIRVELNHTDADVAAVGLPARRQRHPDPRGRAQPRRRGPRRHPGLQGPAAADQGVRGRPATPRSTAASAISDSDTGYTGMAELEVTAADARRAVRRRRRSTSTAARDLPCHTGLVLLSDRGTALGRVGPDKQVHLVRGDREAFGIHGRSAEQRIALEMLLDPEVGIVSLGGRAGTGKSALALCAGLEAVLERRQHKKVVVFRPLFAVGGQELGYLPGSESEKMSPWAQAVFDTLGAITSREVIEEVLDRGMLEVLPLTHIRGRSLHDAFVIVDEAQSLERNVLLTVLSRIGANSKVVLTHDVAQRDNLRVGPARRRGRGGREAQGPPAVRPRHADPLRALADRGPGHRDAGERHALSRRSGRPGP